MLIPTIEEWNQINIHKLLVTLLMVVPVLPEKLCNYAKECSVSPTKGHSLSGLPITNKNPSKPTQKVCLYLTSSIYERGLPKLQQLWLLFTPLICLKWNGLNCQHNLHSALMRSHLEVEVSELPIKQEVPHQLSAVKHEW